MEDKVVNFKVAKLAKEKGFSNGTSRRLTHYKEESNHPEDGTKGPFGWEKNEIQIDDSFIVNGRRGLGDLSNEFYDCYGFNNKVEIRYETDAAANIMQINLLIDENIVENASINRTSSFTGNASYDIDLIKTFV